MLRQAYIHSNHLHEVILMNVYRTFVWLNGFFLLLMLALIGYAELNGLSVKQLFLHPQVYPNITTASFTRLFQILCAVPPTVCLFTYHLLKTQPSKPTEARFILCSALITGGFLLNEIYRIHIYLAASGIGKPIVILFYTVILILYTVGFRKQLRLTPYPLLLIGLGILFVGIGIDSLQIPNQPLTDFLEGIPKVLSEVNVAFYFWCVCQQSILRNL